MSVQIGKHLLTPFQPDIQKEDDGDGFITQIGVLVQSRLDRRPAMLPVVDDKPGRHRDPQRPDTPFGAGVTLRVKLHLAIDRSGQCRKGVVFRIGHQVPGHLGDSLFIQDPLSP